MHPTTPTPIFLFSLPRSGSTLAQRVLAADNNIATTPEPWLLLPLVYSLKSEGMYTEYNHNVCAIALEGLCNELPNKKNDYQRHIHNFCTDIYKDLSKNNELYFLDKTPRYHLISQDIVDIFPDSKYIYLWRNPLSIAASIIETWGEGRWSIYRFKIDLFEGLERLIETYSNQDSGISVRYEDLMTNKENWREIFDYLDLKFNPRVLSEFTQTQLPSELGDLTGSKAYNEVSSEPLEKWKKTMANPLRKAWCKRYLLWIGKERLEIMGYDIDSLLKEISDIPFSFRYLISDMLWMPLGFLYCLTEPYVFIHKFRKILKWRHIHVHR